MPHPPPHPSLARRARAAAWPIVLAVLAGCSSLAPPGREAPPASADDRAAAPAALVTERRWLQSWFEGTPVGITQGRDGAVNIEVPREFCFDRGKSAVKPALAAVLDKVAESLRRVSTVQVMLLAAPADPGGAGALALQRAREIHKHLLSRGVPATRAGTPSAAATGGAQLRLQVTPL